MHVCFKNYLVITFVGSVKAIELLLDVCSDLDVLGRDRNGKGVLHKAIHYLQETFDVEQASEKYIVSSSLSKFIVMT